MQKRRMKKSPETERLELKLLALTICTGILLGIYVITQKCSGPHPWDRPDSSAIVNGKALTINH